MRPKPIIVVAISAVMSSTHMPVQSEKPTTRMALLSAQSMQSRGPRFDTSSLKPHLLHAVGLLRPYICMSVMKSSSVQPPSKQPVL